MRFWIGYFFLEEMLSAVDCGILYIRSSNVWAMMVVFNKSVLYYYNMIEEMDLEDEIEQNVQRTGEELYELFN